MESIHRNSTKFFIGLYVVLFMFSMLTITIEGKYGEIQCESYPSIGNSNASDYYEYSDYSISLPRYLEIYGKVTFSFLILLVPFILVSYKFCGTGCVATVFDCILKVLMMGYASLNVMWIVGGIILIIPYIPTCLDEKNVIVTYTLGLVIANGIATLTGIIVGSVTVYVSCIEHRQNRYDYTEISL